VYVFHKGNFHAFFVRIGADYYRNTGKAGNAGGPAAPFSGYNGVIPVAGIFGDYRFYDPVFPYRIGKFPQFFFIKLFAGLIGIGFQPVKGKKEFPA
jgi:hypothetical protein